MRYLMSAFFCFCILGFLQAERHPVRKNYSSKLSSSTVNKLLRSPIASIASKAQTEGSDLFIYIRLKPDADINYLHKEYGLRLNTGSQGLFTAFLPASSIHRLSQEDTVVEIDSGNEIKHMCDAMLLSTQVAALHLGTNLPSTYRGKGVLIGIIDNGFDFTHPNFKTPEGQCRIACVWDQSRTSGGSASPHGYGRIFQTAQEILAARSDISFDTHGTHVAGIASGSANTPYRGVAPEAELLLVASNKTEQGVVDAVDFLLKYAEKEKKPLIINLSMGSPIGFKDSTDKFCLLTDALMQNRKGRLMVIAAGNEGHRKATLNGDFESLDTPVKTILAIPSYGRENVFLQGQSGIPCRLTITLRDTLAHRVVYSKSFESELEQTVKDSGIGSGEKPNGTLVLSSFKNPKNGNPAFNFHISHSKPVNEVWEIEFSASAGRFLANCAYGSFVSHNKPGYSEGNTDLSIAATATGKNSISVGAYVSKTGYQSLSGETFSKPWQKDALYPLSAKGPSYDGRIKPDITAPGAIIVSSFSSFAPPYSTPAQDKVMEIVDASNRRYAWGVASGTSMAAPVVTGILALWLQTAPELSLENVLELFNKTAHRDEHTGSEANARYGAGKIDALKGLKNLLETSSLPRMQKNEKPFHFVYEPQSATIRFLTNETIQTAALYSLSGQIIMQADKISDKTLRLPEPPMPGLYLLRIQLEQEIRSIKCVLP